MKHGDFVAPAKTKEEAIAIAVRCNRLIEGLDKADQFCAVLRLTLLGQHKLSGRIAAPWGVYLMDMTLPEGEGELPGQAAPEALPVHTSPGLRES